MQYLILIILTCIAFVALAEEANTASDFEQQLASIQSEFEQAQDLLDSLPEALNASTGIYDEIEVAINDVINKLDNDAPIFAQLDRMEAEFAEAKLEYFNEYLATNDQEFRDIAEEFTKLEIRIQQNRKGILAERNRAMILKEEFVVLRKKTIGWVRLNQSQKAVAALDEFRESFSSANQRLDQYVTELKDVNQFNQIDFSIPVN